MTILAKRPSRLDELRLLKDGWLEGEGDAPSEKGLDWLAEALEKHIPEDVPSPFLYPTPEGGVQMEWSMGTTEISLDIDLGKRLAVWHSLNFETDVEECESMDLGDEASWQSLVTAAGSLTIEPRFAGGAIATAHRALPMMGWA